MLKTSLEHEPSNIIARAWVNKTGDDSGSQETAAKTLKTLTYVRKYVVYMNFCYGQNHVLSTYKLKLICRIEFGLSRSRISRPSYLIFPYKIHLGVYISLVFT